MNFLSHIIIIGLISIASFFGYHAPVQTPVETPMEFGAFNPTGGQTYRLQSSVSSTQNTVTLTSFKEPISNIKYTMTYLNSSIEYATIEPQNNSSKEFVSFTGITQNADNTATLTGVTRGLGFSYPYTASTTLAQPHSGQSIFILSNPPQLTNQYAGKINDETITGTWTFSTTPTITNAPVNATDAANKAYIDGVAVSGAPNSTESVKGIVELATQLESASSTSLGSTGASVVLQAKYATSTPGSSASLNTVITLNDGKISPAFLNGSGENYTFNGTTTANSIVLATTTITSANIASTSTGNLNVPTTNGFGTPGAVLQDSSTYTTSATATTTLATYSISGNTIGINGTLKYSLFMVGSGLNNQKRAQVSFGNGSSTTTIGYMASDADGVPGVAGASLTGIIRNLNSASIQISSSQAIISPIDTAPVGHSVATSTVNTTSKFYISLDARVVNASDSVTLEGFTLEKLP